MIRALFKTLILLLIFSAGLVAAAVWQGQMSHLRQVRPQGLPHWTDRIAPEAGLRDGRMELEATGQRPELTLQWAARWPDGAGWHWDLRLTGEGVELAGELTLGLWPSQAVITLTGGTLDLGRLAPIPAAASGIGTIETGGFRIIGLLDTPAVSGEVSGRVTGVLVAGTEFGDGSVTVALAPDGAWQADIAVSGGASPAAASARGLWPAPTAEFTLTLDDASGLPNVLKDLLASTGRPAGAGWIVEGTARLF